MRTPPVVGQKIYVLNVGNSARNVPQVLKPATVTKVGRKYFQVTKDDMRFTYDFHLDTWREKTEFSPNAELYLSEQAWRDDQETDELLRLLREFFSYGSSMARALGLDTLRQIQSLCIKQK